MKQPIITIIDYGIGNTNSVLNALKTLGYYKINISSEHKLIENSDALILPGVGAFQEAMSNLKKNNLLNVLNKEVLENKKPIMGICLGMQIMGSSSTEKGLHKGLNWIKGKVLKLKLPPKFKAPHVGWNQVSFNIKSNFYSKKYQSSNFYFDHNYHFICDNSNEAIGKTLYGQEITTVINKENILGVQFHPEKSQNSGLRLFRKFFNNI